MVMSFDKDFEKFLREFIKRILSDSNLWRVFEEAGLPKPSEKDIDDAVKFLSNMRFYGFSITMGPDGKPVIHEIKPDQFFTNINNFLKPVSEGEAGEGSGEVSMDYEGFIDLIEYDDRVTIVVETDEPGKINVRIDNDRGEAIVEIGDKTHTLNLPFPVEEKPVQRKYRNGILELVFRRISS